MTYQETLSYLFNRLPMYQRVGKAAYKVDLANTIALCELLQRPQDELKFIHLAGTNGKGSTSHILASILQTAGYKVGLYTSPHLIDFRERIKINGNMIPEGAVVEFVQKFKQPFEQINLSFFEWTVGLALNYFKEQEVDIVVLETGLGGRLDSTNIVKPEVSVITNIGLDHTQFLGDTLKKIAAEKAGIIKPNVPVVIGEYNAETIEVFKDKASEENAIIHLAQEVTNVPSTDLKGCYQSKNLKTAIRTIDVLRERGWVINDVDIVEGSENVIRNTNLRGRWEVLLEIPKIICDVGHNEDGIKLILDELSKESFNHLHFVFGTVNDKSLDAIIKLLPDLNCTYYLCQANIPRALELDQLVKYFRQFNKQFIIGGSVRDAMKLARERMGERDLMFVGGSTFVVAEAL